MPAPLPGKPVSAKRIYAAAAAISGWFALGAQLGLALHSAPATPAGVAHAIAGFLAFFTNLTNLLVAAAMTLWAWGRDETHMLTRPQGATALAVYISIVSVVYAGILRELWEPTGLQLFVEALMHYVLPPACIIYWLAFVPKGHLRWVHAYAWLLYPVAYGAYVAARGAVTGHYPYPFLDVAALGYPRVLHNLVPLILLFLIVGFSFIALDQWLARRHPCGGTTPSAPSAPRKKT